MPQIAVHRDFKVVTDGITLACKLSAPPGTPTSHIEDKITLLERFVQNPDQIKMEFEKQIELTGVTLVADKPKTGDREFTFRIEVTGASMIDRSTLYNLAQTKTKVTAKIVEVDNGSRKKKDEPKSEDKTEITDISKPRLVENTPEERLHTALFLKIGARDRWDALKKAGASDSDIKLALVKEWNDEMYKNDEDAFSKAISGDNLFFTATCKKGEPGFWLADRAGVQANITSKPAYKGAELLKAVRELLEIPLPAKESKSKSTHTAAGAQVH